MGNQNQGQTLNLIPKDKAQPQVTPQQQSPRRSVKKKNLARARRPAANVKFCRKLPNHLLCLVKGSGFRIRAGSFPRKFRTNLENNDIENCIGNLTLNINIFTHDT
jgi:hypothetical protein